MSCKDHEMIARVIQARFGVQRADAEDAASHGLMACIEYGKQDLRYAIASAKNFVRDGFKERRFNDAPVEDIFEDSIHLATAPGQELTIEATQVIERLMSLPPRQREVMALTACEYTPSEIKNCLGVSTKAVNQRLVAARKTMRSTCDREAEARRFIGVSRYYRKFAAKIKANGKTIYLGLFPSAEEAARKYDAMAVQLLGEGAKLHFQPAP